MKKITAILFLTFLALTASAPAVGIPGYYQRSGFLFAPSSVYNDGLLGFTNPANLALIPHGEVRLAWSTDGTDFSSFHNWGLMAAAPNFGFDYFRDYIGNTPISDYRLGLAFGSPGHTIGLSYGWSTGGNDDAGREKIMTIGTIARPNKYISTGLVYNESLEGKDNELIGDIGLRPAGNPVLTVFADAALKYNMSFSDLPWSIGAIIEPAAGINIIGRYFDSEAFTIGVSIGLGSLGFGSQSYYDKSQHHTGYSNYVRVGSVKPSYISEYFERDRRFVAMSLKGTVVYHKYRYFDNSGPRLYDILNEIKAAATDPRVGALAINLSGMRVYPEHAWEIRNQLIEFKTSGKPVIIFIDLARMTQYHLASVADVVVMDPQGYLLLSGYVSGRTYFKGTLEKLGLGFEPWRFFKYKSGPETYSRDNMSPADREQRQAYIDDRYDLARDEICTSRLISADDFDNIIDNVGYLDASDALEYKLVDTLARWSDVGGVVRALSGRFMWGIAPENTKAIAVPSQTWGPKPKIAVVYAIGECEMDNGIRARWLEYVFDALTVQPDITAVVFRVDSPGGYGLPSDLVAQAVRKCAAVKPVIVSQGQMAASGGYWISAFGNEIVAGPGTLTGSIGVYGGWVYDKDFTEKLGMTYDFVKRGVHADLLTGVRLPLIGITVPGRNLTDDEYAIMKKAILKHYDQFVSIVSEGRNIPEERVREIGQGRVYSGTDGIELGLVDIIGSLTTAIDEAKDRAGLAPDQEVDIIEIPKYKGLFDIHIPGVPDIPSLKDDPSMKYLKMITDSPTEPLFMLPPDFQPGQE